MGVGPIRCSLEQAAWVVGKTPLAFRRQLERMRRRMGGGIIRFDDIEAVLDSANGWEVTYGESWLVNGQLVQWLTSKKAALQTPLKAGSLRCAARRNRPDNAADSAYGDLRAKRLCTRWLFCFVRDYPEAEASERVAR